MITSAAAWLCTLWEVVTPSMWKAAKVELSVINHCQLPTYCGR